MPFAFGLRQLLELRDDQLSSELCRGDSLQAILDRHLLAVEEKAESDLVTSILLLSADGKRLCHAAGPSLPQSYRDSIDGSEIGPSAGSCGTAAYFGCPIYVDNIAVDPLWADYRHLALAHGLRSCWSTPIRDAAGVVIGTFAIYHRTVGSPTRDELEAIEMITGHVAQAIMSARHSGRLHASRGPPVLKLVSNSNEERPSGPFAELLMKVTKLEAITAQLERQASREECGAARASMEVLAGDSHKLAVAIRDQIARSTDLPH